MLVALLAGCTGEADSAACTLACGGACEEDYIPATSRSHTTEEIVYDDPPPTGGDHNACWATWGVHTEELDDDNWVHNLEHGGIVYLYHCDDCDDDVAALTDLVQGLDAGRAVLTPYSLMSWRYAAVSWQHRMLMECLDVDAMRQFFDDHVAQAPEVSTADPTGCM